MTIRTCVLILGLAATAAGQNPATTAPPKIWDDAALETWATPIAALGVRPSHFSSAEYYSVPADNLMTYPVYRPDREPPGYWDWLQKQKPKPLVDVAGIRRTDDWIKAGETAFLRMDSPAFRTNDPETIRTVRDLKSYDGVWIQRDGTLKDLRWVVTERGVEVTNTECAGCHSGPRADGTVFWGVPTSNLLPSGSNRIAPVRRPRTTLQTPLFFPGDSLPVIYWRMFTTPWAPDERVERWRSLGPAGVGQISLGATNQTVPRPHSSPHYAPKVPDLNILRYSRYLDATGTHQLRGPEDVARYAAFLEGADPMEFGKYKILDPKQRRVPVRYADEVLYAIGMYLLSLEPMKNSAPDPAALIERGRGIFKREKCIDCHVPPNYTSGKLTLAQGFELSQEHPNIADTLPVSVGTDPGLAMKTRKGTGFYKIPSLRGLWYRPALLHDGSVGSLEEMFDAARQRPEHIPAGWKAPGVTHRAILGHPFGLGLNAKDKNSLLAFLRSL